MKRKAIKAVDYYAYQIASPVVALFLLSAFLPYIDNISTSAQIKYYPSLGKLVYGIFDFYLMMFFFLCYSSISIFFLNKIKVMDAIFIAFLGIAGVLFFHFPNTQGIIFSLCGAVLGAAVGIVIIWCVSFFSEVFPKLIESQKWPDSILSNETNIPAYWMFINVLYIFTVLSFIVMVCKLLKIEDVTWRVALIVSSVAGVFGLHLLKKERIIGLLILIAPVLAVTIYFFDLLLFFVKIKPDLLIKLSCSIFVNVILVLMCIANRKRMTL